MILESGDPLATPVDKYERNMLFQLRFSHFLTFVGCNSESGVDFHMCPLLAGLSPDFRYQDVGNVNDIFYIFFSLLRLFLPLLLLLLPHPLLLPVLPFLFLLLLPLLFLDFFPSLFFLILNVLTPSVRGPVPKPILTKAPVGWINNIALFRYQLYYKKERIFFQ